MAIQFIGIYIVNFNPVLYGLHAGGVKAQVFFVYIVYTLEDVSVADRPAQRGYLNLKFFFYFIQQVERVLSRAVEFVDEHDDRGFAHPAYLHEFAGLALDTFGGVNHDNYAVASRQYPESIFGEILMAGSVKNIDFNVFVFKTHNGCGNRDSSLAFYFHEVGSCRFLNLV